MIENNHDFDGLATRAASRLIQLADTVRQVAPVDRRAICFELSRLGNVSYLKELHADVRAFAKSGDPALYVFQPQDPELFVALAEAFEERPACRQNSSKECKYSRINIPINPRALYVGSSWSLPSRISQHLGRTGGDGTYAMRLSLWAQRIVGIIELRLWRFEAEINPIELEAIEQ